MPQGPTSGPGKRRAGSGARSDPTGRDAAGGKPSAASRRGTLEEQYGTLKLNGSSQAAPSVHCMLAPMEGEALLLPTTAIAEIIDYHPPVPMGGTPEWFLGQVEWEGRQIPVFSYAALISGNEPGEVTPRTRVMIVKSLSALARVPYLGILISDIPKLMNLEPDDLLHAGDESKSMGVFSHVSVQGQPAVVPDLERLTQLVTHTAYGVLPITHFGN